MSLRESKHHLLLVDTEGVEIDSGPSVKSKTLSPDVHTPLTV